jgi:hypothetical protein
MKAEKIPAATFSLSSVPDLSEVTSAGPIDSSVSFNWGSEPYLTNLIE